MRASIESSPRWLAESPPLKGEPFLRRLLDKLPAGAYTCDADGLITYYNPHAERVWGRAPRLNDPEDRFCGSFKLRTSEGAPIPHNQCWMALALQHEKEYNGCEIVVERPDGQVLTVLAHANPIYDESGRLLGAVNVLVDISDRKRAENAVKEADRAKSDFLATVSHEIRTPINAIIGYADLLELEIAGPLTERQRTQLARIRGASQHLASLINEVLDLAKIEAGQMVLRREVRRMNEAVEAALAVIHPLATAKGITLVNRSGEPELVYVGDEDRVRQMLINLLSNAIKFSEPGSSVEVGYRVAEQPEAGVAFEADGRRWVCFEVQDSGIGIAPDQLERIFEPFVQVEAPHTRTRGGTGLGLTISRRLARLMGGDLTVQSEVGAGSVFRLWLPAAPLVDGPTHSLHPVLDPEADGEPSARASCFSAAGQVLLANLDEIVRGYLERLRREEIGPGSRTLSSAKLANHVATLVADLAVTLLALESGADTTSPLTTGFEVQQVCAVTHGRQRGHLGWSEADVAREYDALASEITRCLRRQPGDEATREEVLGAIRNHLERARVCSVRGLQSARAEG